MPHPQPPLLHHTVYRSHPDADWIVLVHGAGITSEIWAHQVEAYREEFNLVLPDLRGHGGSAALDFGGEREPYTFEAVTRDLLGVLDHHGIEAAHFVGISMGCLVVRTLAEIAPGRMRSMVLVGAIARLKVRARLLIVLAHALKRLVPHMWLYGFYAWILLPRRAHADSRRAVVRDAEGLTRVEFLRWLPLTHDLPGMLRRFEAHDPGVPTLYVMGDEDHMFLPGARAVAAEHRSASIHIMEGCGHVCTLQRPEAFNRVSLEFLRATRRDGW